MKAQLILPINRVNCKRELKFQENKVPSTIKGPNKNALSPSTRVPLTKGGSNLLIYSLRKVK
jgi:hypothetical protein